MTVYIGVDNGLSGGISAIDENQNVLFSRVMPIIQGKGKSYDLNTISNIFNKFDIDGEIFVVLEKAHVRPISGKRACFMTGYGYGALQGVLSALNIPYEIIRPKDWQQDILMGINTGDTKKDSILWAKKKYPKLDLKATERCTKDHDGKTDSLAMAVYCYRRNK